MTTRIKWTRETITDIIKQCKSKKEFRKKYSGAFTAIKTHGWTDLYNLMPKHTFNNQLKWTRDAILAAIQTCSSRSEFRKRYDQAYEQMNRHGWRDLLNYISPANHKWTLSELETISSGYETRFQFRHENPDAYDAIKRNQWHHLIKDMPIYPPVENEPSIWSVYRWYFPETNSIYIGLSMHVNRRIKDELKYSKTSPIRDHIDSTGSSYRINILHENLHSYEAARYEDMYISQYRAEGYNVLNRMAGGNLGAYNIATACQRSDEDILDEVFSKYTSYRDLRTKGKSLYREICNRNLRQKVWEKLPKVAQTPKYSIEYLSNLAAGCTHFYEFKNKYPHEYKYMAQKGLCHLLSHLDRTTAISIPDRFENVVTEVNSGKLTRKSAASKLGITPYQFSKLGKDKLKSYGEISLLKAQTNATNKKIAKEAKRDRVRRELLDLATSNYKTILELRSDKNLYARIMRRPGLYKEISALLTHQRRSSVTCEDVETAVAKCSTFSQFMKEYPSEYQAVRNNHWEELVSGLPKSYKKADEFSYEHIWDCAHKCSSRTEFNKKYSSESYAAKKRGIYDEIVADMPKQYKKSS